MNKILNPWSNDRVKDFLVLFLRLAVGALLLSHGYPKLQKLLSGDPIEFASVMGMSQKTSLMLAMFAEYICAIMVMLGLFTRLAAIPIIITMLVIVLHIKSNGTLSERELPLLYLIFYIFILFSGAGKHSLDNIICKFLKRKN
ncbi:MAG: DoxX family protein [Bacteroidetes bacterium]|jgi:putative oxidoreductase|nr:DoxX family protein [Bacteroidota bacterium]